MNLFKKSPAELPAFISTLWIFLLFNMVFADIFSFMYPGFMAEIISGDPIDGMVITPGFLLVGALITELSIIMVVLSKSLKPRANRLMNIIAAIVTIVWVIGGGSLTPHYVFFASIEVITSILIISLVWKKSSLQV